MPQTKARHLQREPGFHRFTCHYLLIHDNFLVHRPIYKEYRPHPDDDFVGHQRYVAKWQAQVAALRQRERVYPRRAMGTNLGGRRKYRSTTEGGHDVPMLPLPPRFYKASPIGACPFVRPQSMQAPSAAAQAKAEASAEEPTQTLATQIAPPTPPPAISLAHKIKRRQQMYQRLFAQRKPGYCECCHENYDDLDKVSYLHGPTHSAFQAHRHPWLCCRL